MSFESFDIWRVQILSFWGLTVRINMSDVSCSNEKNCGQISLHASKSQKSLPIVSILGHTLSKKVSNY
jgi:hypothetical protein